MTKTVLGWICLIFFGLVAVDYLGNNLAGGLFSYGGTAARAQQSASQVQLGSIDFSFFGKGQKGRSYITQGYGKTLWYAHLGNISVTPGDKLKKGDLIGTVGSSGYETGTHLHFSVFEESGFAILPRNGCGPDAVGKDVNPLSYLGTTYQ